MYQTSRYYNLFVSLLLFVGLAAGIGCLFYFSPYHSTPGDLWLTHFSPDSTHQLQMYGVNGKGFSPTELHFYEIDKAGKKRHLISTSLYNQGNKVIAGINYQIIWQGSYAFVILKENQKTPKVYPLLFQD